MEIGAKKSVLYRILQLLFILTGRFLVDRYILTKIKDIRINERSFFLILAVISLYFLYIFIINSLFWKIWESNISGSPVSKLFLTIFYKNEYYAKRDMGLHEVKISIKEDEFKKIVQNRIEKRKREDEESLLRREKEREEERESLRKELEIEMQGLEEK